MFNPVGLRGRLFKRYLRLGLIHPGKIRIENIAGRLFFSRGIYLKDTNGVTFLLDSNDWITRIMLLEGDYESGSTMLAKKILQGGGSFLDIGANFGLFTTIVAHSNTAVEVIAVEPNYKIIGRLIKNIGLNGLQERVKVFNTAVSSKFQFVTLQQAAPDNMGTTLTSTTGKGELSILSCSLDFICEHYRDKTLDLLKIDIEGNEFDILREFSFEKCMVKNIILEFNHLSTVTFAQLVAFFESKGFKCFTISGEPLLNEKHPIPDNNIWFVNQRG